MSNYKEFSNRDLEISDKTFQIYTVKEESIFMKTFTNCIFNNIKFEKCDFGKVSFINCKFYGGWFSNCTSMAMVIKGSEFINAYIMESKFNSTSIENTIFDNFRFYNNVFKGTKFESCHINKTLMENSSFTKTTMINVKMMRMFIVSIDFRNSSFNKVDFAFKSTNLDSLILESCFTYCKFDNCDLEKTLMVTTDFSDSHFISGTHMNSRIINVLFCDFKNVKYERTGELTSDITGSHVDKTALKKLRKWSEWGDSSEKQILALPPSLQSGHLDNPNQEYIYPLYLSKYAGKPNTSGIIYLPQKTQPQNTLAERWKTSRWKTTTKQPTKQPAEPTKQPAEPIKPQIRQTLFEKTSVNIPKNQTAYDIIDGKVKLLTYMEENPDTVAFLYDNEYFITTKTNITRIIPQKLSGDEKITYSTRLPDNSKMIAENFNLRRLLKNLVIPLNKLELVLDYAFGNYINYRLYEIVATKKVSESVVSFRVLFEAESSNVSHDDIDNDGRLCDLRIITTNTTGGANKTKRNLTKKTRTKTNRKR